MTDEEKKKRKGKNSEYNSFFYHNTKKKNSEYNSVFITILKEKNSEYNSITILKVICPPYPHSIIFNPSSVNFYSCMSLFIVSTHTQKTIIKIIPEMKSTEPLL